MRNCLLTVLLIICCTPTVMGQKNVFENNKAQKYFEKAVLYDLRREPIKAEKYYLKCIKKDGRHREAYYALAHLYRDQQNFKDAAEILSQCSTCKSKSDILLRAADLFRSGAYSQANALLSQLPGSASLSPEENMKIRLLSASIRMAVLRSQEAKDTLLFAENLSHRINTGFDEYFPSVSLDDSVIVFTRKTNGIDQDFYLAHRDSCGGWFTAHPLGSPPNSPSQEGAQMLSADGHYLFFTRCENVSDNGWALGGCDLYFSYDVSEGWSQPVPFGATINTPAYEGMPSLSPDNKVLYFVSDREGGFGGKDIWMSRFEDGLWQVPENLGPFINTAGDETAPWVAADNQTLYFTSDGHPGFGGNDIFVVKRQPGGFWGMPENLGTPINSPSDDVSLIISNDGKKAYFSSNRPGGEGGMDLYEAEMPLAHQPESRIFIYGIVKDSLSQERIPNAVMTWRNAYNGSPIAEYESNRGDASFIAAFPLDFDVAVEVSMYGYLSYRDTFCFKEAHMFPPDTFNIALLPYDYSPTLSDTDLLMVHFPKNSYSVSDSDVVWVKELIKPYKDGEYNEFFVNGFADVSGNPVINENISLRRAHSLKMVLIAAGVPEERIHVHGWSDTNPIASNDTEEGRALNRRVELVVRRPE